MLTTLVFIPGLVSDRRAWTEVEQYFASKGHKTGIADLYSAVSIKAMAQSVLEQFTGQIIPVGHSMGGRVAMEIARIAPERLQGLVLVATGAHPLAEGELSNRERVIELANTQGMQALCDQWLPPMLRVDIRTTDPKIYNCLEQMVLEAGATVHERQIRALIGRPDAQPLLAALKMPTLLVAGELDTWSTPAQHQKIADSMLAAKASFGVDVQIVNGAGHFLQVEQPEAFSYLLEGWLEKQSSQS